MKIEDLDSNDLDIVMMMIEEERSGDAINELKSLGISSREAINFVHHKLQEIRPNPIIRLKPIRQSLPKFKE